MTTLIVLIILLAAVLLAFIAGRRKAAPVVPAAPETPRQLTDGKGEDMPEEKVEKLPPDKARQWLDDFLQKQQK